MEGGAWNSGRCSLECIFAFHTCSLRVNETQLRLGFRLYGLWFQDSGDLGAAALHVKETQLRFVEV